MPSWLMLGGAAFLVFRLWLTEDKLKDELQFRRHYLSRFLNYYAALVMINEFQVSLWNYIMLVSFPIICVSLLGWDIPFFYKFKRRTYWEKNHGWLIIERLTMHPPIIIIGAYLWLNGLHNFIDLTNLPLTLTAGIILVFGPWFLWDKRWTDNYIAPIRINITIFAVISLSVNTWYLITF